MAKEKLILIVSARMDTNKKENRNEHGLVRMSKAARENMGFQDKVELYPATKRTEDRLKGTMLLDIFQAFSDDIKKAKAEGVSPEDLRRVGFVTSKTFAKITGNTDKKKSSSVWITEDVNDTVIGADPEFLLFDANGGVVRANNVMSYNGAIGCDGAMAEVRPAPAISPEDLVQNIRTLFADRRLTSNIADYDWKAGCYHKDKMRDYPIGGHIHIGNPVQVTRINNDRRMDFFKSFNRILDELLALPMIKIDGADLGRARRTECTMGKYGYFGEFRPCNGRLEYRTLSGMWLMHPTLTTVVFGTAKAIIDEIYRHVADKKFSLDYMFPSKLRGAHIWSATFDQWNQIPLVNDFGCTLPSREMIELLHKSSANKITAKFLKAWHDRMKGMSTYKTYAKYVDGLYELLKNNTKAFQDYDKELKKNWLHGAKFLN
jgi:hypothetical protein